MTTAWWVSWLPCREARLQLTRREEVAVRRGRQAGLSWAEIGTLLGVTKQTMHRKYRKVG